MGSFADAGLELHLTPSAISHQIRALEDWFGKPMFTRTGRKVTLTEDGRRLLAELSQAFDLMEDACSALRPTEHTRLAVHSAPSFAAKWLGPRLRDFMDTHPSITIQLTSSAEPVALNDSEVHVDIAYGTPLHDSGVIVEPLGMEATVPLCSPSLIKHLENPVPADLAHFTLIESKLNPVRWTDWWRLNGLKPPTRDRPSFDRGSLAIAAAVDGVGIALETTRFAERELARKDLVILDGPGYRRFQRQFHFLCYKKSNRHNEQLQAFRSWLYSRLDTNLGV